MPQTNDAPDGSADLKISHPAIRDFPSGERPRERLQSYGAGHLSNSELLTILLRTGLEGENVLVMASRLLAEFGGLSGLSRITFDEMCDLRGISSAKACQILAGIELGSRVASLTPEDRVTITSPSDFATLFMAEMSSLDREHLRVATLSTRNQVLGIEDLYSGSVNAALIRPAEVFATAVRRNAPQIAIPQENRRQATKMWRSQKRWLKPESYSISRWSIIW